MEDYSEVAREILARINDRSTRLLAKDVPEVVGGAGRVNCYPGIPGGGCCQTAFFVSLNDSRRHGRGHLKFSAAIPIFVRHMEDCKGTTQVAVIVADTWDAEDVREWQPRIDSIKHHAHVEAYLISGSSVTEIPI